VCHVAAAALLAALSAAPGAADPTAEARATAALREAAAAPTSEASAAAFERAAAIAEITAPASVLAVRARLAARDPAAAEAIARRALASAGPPWEADLFDALAQARDAQGDAAGARAAWAAAQARGLAPDRAGVVRLALAESHAAAGDLDAAARVLRTEWIAGAARASSDRAEERLDALEASAGRSLRGAHDWIERADALFAAQRSDASLRAYERALAAGAAGADRAHAGRRRADCLFRIRRYDEAAAAYAALGAAPELRVWHARSLARANRVEPALAELAAVAGAAPPATAAWACYLAGLLHEGRDHADEARALFTAAAKDGDPKIAADALWRLGFGAYRAGDYDIARRHLDALAARQPDPIERLAARYWSARARAATDADGAGRELAAVASEFPFTYYGVRAAERTPAPPAARPRDDGAPTLDDGDLLPARVLAAAGFADLAQRALGALAARAATRADRLAVARVYAAAGDPYDALDLLVRADAETLARGPGSGDDALWRLAWPDAFAGERRAARAPDSRLDPWLVAALMREESGYRPDAESVTGALGLLQLMPDTARRLAAGAGLDALAPGQLLDPALNVRLGTLLLEQLAARFDGRPEAVAAAYNAGAEPVAAWRVAPIADPAEWVETIPYEETRGYVKRVVRSLAVYRMLYR
jgi:soluble lytic murein transglycosylase